MINLTITPNIDEAPWKDLAPECPELGTIERIGRLPRGTTSGKSTVSIVIRMPDGKRYMAQTTLALMDAAMTALKTREHMDKAHAN
jgi:hypothetical protein